MFNVIIGPELLKYWLHQCSLAVSSLLAKPADYTISSSTCKNIFLSVSIIDMGHEKDLFISYLYWFKNLISCIPTILSCVLNDTFTYISVPLCISKKSTDHWYEKTLDLTTDMNQKHIV